MSATAILITYGFFTLLSLTGLSIVIRNSFVIDKASKELEQEYFLEKLRWS